ncbi:5-formyltetrahydrofolate cyclo-ligase [Spongiibacter sp. KMU-158]|uniref:5-formyltetrahydrofolate cyclo-ligase n=1 Tax=Spongiibacter pelagi TaxID=2760804 RepID=A0A927GVA4_9GAMM|nr:5-formyltetrahydrofolate cyclo-ligase [Spongiibacter pelagi]MBD2857868.1 5-formyltetrahydrofolate cyclo-ligase [Spongiibacter pelagi]
MLLSKSALRSQLRQARRALSEGAQARASRNIAKALFALPEFEHSKNIAAYLANDGEVSCSDLLNQFRLLRQVIYLPVIHPQKPQMSFYGYQMGQGLFPNRFGIEEPAHKRRAAFSAENLDMVLMPLVGFDRQGNRLGMGGGFYDRCFSFKKQRNTPPLMIGIAHSIQEVNSLPTEPWDVPLDIILTERETIRIQRR